MKLLVTGGNGFIGSHFILEMINQGHYILNIDKSGNNTTIKQRLNKNVIKNYYFCKSNNWSRRMIKIKKIVKDIMKNDKLCFKKKKIIF